LRQRRLRPQLKRDPLGGSTECAHTFSASPVLPWPANEVPMRPIMGGLSLRLIGSAGMRNPRSRPTARDAV